MIILYINLILFRVDACFYLLNVKKATIESHRKTVNIINGLNNIKNLFESYSISDIEVINLVFFNKCEI